MPKKITKSKYAKLPERKSSYDFGWGSDASSSAVFFFGFIPHLHEVDADFVAKDMVTKINQIRAKQAEVAALEADLTPICANMAKYINKHWTPDEIHEARRAANAPTKSRERSAGKGKSDD